MKKRTNYNLKVVQHKQLRIMAAIQGVSASELLRQILDEWFEKHGENIQIQIVSNGETDKSN